MKNIALMMLISACLFGCNPKQGVSKAVVKVTNDTVQHVQDSIQVAAEDSTQQSPKSVDEVGSLVESVSETAYSTNPKLLKLLDNLYQHVLKSSFPSSLKREEKWMTAYRAKLVAYYDAHHHRGRSISNFAKADSVLNEGARLLEVGCNWSTIDIIVNNRANYALDRCREYGLLTQVISSCKSDEAREFVYQEWNLYEKMLKKMRLIASNTLRLKYWGGSIVGPAVTDSHLKLSKVRRDMYQSLLNIIKDGDRDNSGVYMDQAISLLIDSSAKTLRVASDGYDGMYDSGEERQEHSNVVKETKQQISEIRPLLNQWAIVVGKLNDALAGDGDSHSVKRVASLMLREWAGVVTED